MTAGNPERVETSTGVFELRSDGILRFRIRPGTRQDAATAEENMKAGRSLLRGVKRPIVVDMREGGPMDRAAREAYSSSRLTSAQALVVGSRFSRVVGNLYVRIGVPRLPVRLFGTVDDAVEWCRQFV